MPSLRPRLLATCARPITRIATPVTSAATRCIKSSPHLEHYGFVAYAGAEAFHIPGGIYFVAVWLFATGVLMEIGAIVRLIRIGEA